ncbi:MAG: EVE domain-containing protein [Alphaproteobacteria bacterium]|nr:EVE domain-containing protein [Alphaproteobacteria bacterium]
MKYWLLKSEPNVWSIDQQKKIVGIVKVIKEHFKDKLDKTNKFVSVMVRGENELLKPVSLKKIKNDKFFKQLALVKQSRLSVMPIDYKSWKIIYNMGKV